jgi:hypothetical protein
MDEKLKILHDKIKANSTQVFNEVIADESFMQECVKISCDNARNIGLKTIRAKQDGVLDDEDVMLEFETLAIANQCHLMQNLHKKLTLGRYQYLKELSKLSQEDFLELELSLVNHNLTLNLNFVNILRELSTADMEIVQDDLLEEMKKSFDVKEDDDSPGCNIFTIPENDKTDPENSGPTIH